jgi:hypothetical protein
MAMHGELQYDIHDTQTFSDEYAICKHCKV